jgi:hypothetical protein
MRPWSDWPTRKRVIVLCDTKENIMARWLMLVLFGLTAFVGVVGCEADADVDEDGAKLKVDVDD